MVPVGWHAAVWVSKLVNGLITQHMRLPFLGETKASTRTEGPGARGDATPLLCAADKSLSSATSRSTSAEKSGSKPLVRIAAAAAVRRTVLGWAFS